MAFTDKLDLYYEGIAVLGATGAGRTEFIMTPAADEAKGVLQECLKCNCFSPEMKFVTYTSELKDKIVVAVYKRHNAKASVMVDLMFDELFPKENKSSDGFYYKEIDLKNPDKEFIKTILQSFANAVLETLATLIVYVPMSTEFEKMCLDDTEVSKRFTNENGFVEFSMIDGVGLNHDFGDLERDVNYAKLLAKVADTVAVISPLADYPSAYGERISKPLQEMFKMEPTKPTVLVQNKVDLVEDCGSIASRSKEHKEAFCSMADVNSDRVEAIPCFLGERNGLSEEVIAEYNPLKQLKAILQYKCSQMTGTGEMQVF
jgi:hypothetical protein